MKDVRMGHPWAASMVPGRAVQMVDKMERLKGKMWELLGAAVTAAYLAWTEVVSMAVLKDD